jgi:hypothetical protein
MRESEVQIGNFGIDIWFVVRFDQFPARLLI